MREDKIKEIQINKKGEKSERQLKVNEELKKIAQDFFQRHTSGQSMITVTSADVSKDMRQCKIGITVMPIEKEKAVFDFAQRLRADMRTDIKHRLPIKTIPFVEIVIDEGEKIRQKLDSILLQDRIRQMNSEFIHGDSETSETENFEENEEDETDNIDDESEIEEDNYDDEDTESKK